LTFVPPNERDTTRPKFKPISLRFESCIDTSEIKHISCRFSGADILRFEARINAAETQAEMFRTAGRQTYHKTPHMGTDLQPPDISGFSSDFLSTDF
jgi:hypothetical protein